MKSQQHIHTSVIRLGTLLYLLPLLMVFCLPIAYSQQWKEMRGIGTGIYHSIFFLDSLHGWTCGEENIILSTTNGGTTWDASTPIEGDINDELYAIHFFDTKNGIATRGKYILRSTDGGKNWVQVGNQYSTAFYSLHFVTKERGWVVGTLGGILITTDGGTRWTKQLSGTNKELYTVHFTDTLNGWAAGRDATFLHTTDGGETWKAEKPVELEATAFINDIFFSDSLHGWAVGVRNRSIGKFSSDLIIATTDGGKTWAEQPTVDFARMGAGLWSVSFTDNLKGWVAGTDGVVCTTTDGGTTWELNWEGLTKRYPDWRSIFMVNEHWGFAVGVGRYIIRYSTMTTSVEQEEEEVMSFVMESTTSALIYPNPVQSKATLRYCTPYPCTATISIYDIHGMLVAQIEENIERAGVVTSNLPIKNLLNGLYVVHINTGNGVQTQAFVVEK